MKNWIIKTAAVIAIAALAGASLAQNAGPRPGGQGRPGGPGMGMRGFGQAMMKAQDKALDKVQASADQKSKVKALNQKEMKARRDFMEKTLGIKLPAPGTKPAAGAGKPGAAAGPAARPKLTDEQMKKMREFGQKQMKSHQAEMKKILGSKYDAYETALKAEVDAMRTQRGAGAGRLGQAPRKP